MTEKESARKATIRAYAARIIEANKKYGLDENYGESQEFIDLQAVAYGGSFGYQAVADSVPISSGSRLTEHQICWKNLFLAFDRAWAVC